MKLERTAYPQFRRLTTARVLHVFFTLAEEILEHASFDTEARYFRAGAAENAAVIERVFGD